MAKTEMIYKKLSLEQMKNYVAKHHNDEESKTWFKSIALKEQKDKDGNPVLDEDGNVILQRNTLTAKKAFYERYKEEIVFTDRQTKPKKRKKDSLVEELMKW